MRDCVYGCAVGGANQDGAQQVRIGTSCGGKTKREPHLWFNGRGVPGWRGSKDEMRERKAFKKLPQSSAAKIEAKKLAELRETMDSILL